MVPWAPLKNAAIAGLCLAVLAAAAAERVFAPFDSVRPVIEALRQQLPPALANPGEAVWNAWSRRQNAEIRARLEQGEVDSMINLLLFGTSFTRRPRIQFESLTEASRSGLLRGRVDDLLQALRAPGDNDRLVFLRSVLRRQGLDPDSDDGKAGLFVFQNLQRVLQENAKFGQRTSPGSPDQTAPFRDRGVSLDATIFPNFAIEQALRDLKTRGLLRSGAVTRAAVIGPGLDFADKQSGYDYYPQQTLQPFALFDSLDRLSLAPAARVSISVFDISSRVLEHMQRARERAQKGRGYTIQLPRDPRQSWKPEAVAYWRAFGDRSGKAATPIRPPAELKSLATRAVEIRPAIVLATEPVDLNIVLERVDLPPAERFDLIVATNVFVYYSPLEQALALQNVSTLLKPGGILLSNDKLPGIPEISMRSIGSTDVYYTDRLGTTVFWYQRP
jgi:SAM-dependent methyltransferase